MKNFRKPTNGESTSKRHLTADETTDEKTPASKKARTTRTVTTENDEDNIITQDKYEEYIVQLQAELAKKGGKNAATIKKLMKKTRERRWKWIRDKKPTVQEVLKVFPSLASELAVSQWHMQPACNC